MPKSPMSFSKKKYDEILDIKDDEIDRLHMIIENTNSSDNYIWWFVGGTTTGIVVSVAIFYAAVEISNK